LPFHFFASNVHAQSPATIYWLKVLAWSRDQVRVQPLLDSLGEKQVDSKQSVHSLAFPYFPKKDELFSMKWGVRGPY
jgi:hypothetical protein